MTETERKLQLTRFIREESAVNRMKMKNREEILYGSGKPVLSKGELPLVYDGHLGEEDFGLARAAQPVRSTFGLRLSLAILLLGAVIYMDKTGVVFYGKPASEMIQAQISVSAEEKLADFVNVLTQGASVKK